MSGFLGSFRTVARVMNSQAAGSSGVDGSSVDLANFDGVLFIACLGALSAGQVTKLQADWSDDNSIFNPFSTDAVTAAAADGDSNKLLILDVFQPGHRYVRPRIQRMTANAAIDGIIAVMYRAKRGAAAVDPSVSQSALFI